MIGGRKDLFKEEQRKAKIYDILLKRVREVFVYLGFPHWYEMKYENHSGNEVTGSHLWHTIDQIDSLSSAGLIDTANHTARLVLYSSALCDILGFNLSTHLRSRTILAVAAERHDHGKVFPETRQLAEKKYEFTREDAEQMKLHTHYSASFAAGLVDGAVGRIIAHHHEHKKEGYVSDWVRGELTQEESVLAKLLESLDVLDAASTRQNTKNSPTPRRLNSDEVKKLFLEQYANLPIEYKGNQMPKISMSGRDLLTLLYNTKIFGKNPDNPFPWRLSFILRKGFFETWKARFRVLKREREIRMKQKKWRVYE